MVTIKGVDQLIDRQRAMGFKWGTPLFKTESDILDMSDTEFVAYVHKLNTITARRKARKAGTKVNADGANGREAYAYLFNALRRSGLIK